MDDISFWKHGLDLVGGAKFDSRFNDDDLTVYSGAFDGVDQNAIVKAIRRRRGWHGHENDWTGF